MSTPQVSTIAAVPAAPAQAKQDLLHTPAVRAALPFINGGLAGKQCHLQWRVSRHLHNVETYLSSGMTATCAIQPIDMIKVRLQLAGQGVRTSTGPAPTSLSITRELLRTGKFLDLYTGLSAGLLRQAVYTTARLGIFDTFMSSLSSRAATTGSTIGFKERAGAGLAAGGLAAMIGNPADLALIRMQSDGLKAMGERANYKSVFDALSRISGQEGIGALWAGAAPTVARAMALNFGQLAFFSEAKVRLKDSGLGARTQTLTGE